MNHLAHLAASERDAFTARRGPLPSRQDGVRPFGISSAGPAALIAEFKRSSPSHGSFSAPNRPSQLRRYAEMGAAAVSVLVAAEGFGGDLKDLVAARRETSLPLLYKGFISVQGQIEEAYAHGADAVLLIAALLGSDLKGFLSHAAAMGLAALCEVHDAEELMHAVEAGATLIGVNNRDLRTLEVDPERFLEIAPKAPIGALLIAESGYRTGAAVRQAVAAGARGILIGEALLTASELQRPWTEVLRDVG